MGWVIRRGRQFNCTGTAHPTALWPHPRLTHREIFNKASPSRQTPRPALIASSESDKRVVRPSAYLSPSIPTGLISALTRHITAKTPPKTFLVPVTLPVSY